jgi:hypothetical protein
MEEASIKIVIITQGGEIQVVYSNADIQYCIVDYDRRGADESPVLGVFEEEGFDDPKVVFNPPKEYIEGDSAYITIYQELTRLGF